jgi:DNA-directed RNA polymerase subunit H (RpoH/RPB5)
MCKRRNYSEFTWISETCATSEKKVWLITDFAALDEFHEQSQEEAEIVVLFEFLKMRRKVKRPAELFAHVDFVYDPLSQSPPMRLLSESEKKTKVLDNWELEAKILSTDIISRYFDAKKGDVFETIQKDRIPTIQTYRLVV